MTEERRAPVQGYSAGIPWAMHLRAYDAYCKMYGEQPALIEGGCRGGFHADELDHFIPGWREELTEIAILRSSIARNDEVLRYKNQVMGVLRKSLGELTSEVYGDPEARVPGLREKYEKAAPLAAKAERFQAALLYIANRDYTGASSVALATLRARPGEHTDWCKIDLETRPCKCGLDVDDDGLVKSLEPSPLASREGALRYVLKLCAKKFREYEALHDAKGTREGAEKAGANAGMAILCEGVLGLEPAPDRKSGTPTIDLDRVTEPGYVETLMSGSDITNKGATENRKSADFSLDRSPSFGSGIWCNQCNEFTTVPHFHAGPTEGKKIK